MEVDDPNAQRGELYQDSDPSLLSKDRSLFLLPPPLSFLRSLSPSHIVELHIMYCLVYVCDIWKIIEIKFPLHVLSAMMYLMVNEIQTML